jgi:hypothetical protein
MEFKVKSIDGIEPKSIQELEVKLVEQHAQQQQQEEPAIEKEETVVEPKAETELREEDVLSYIGKRSNKQINSFDELMTEREQAEELPEDVSAYFKYKKETGRSIEDFIKLRKDFDSMDPESLLKEYFLTTNEGLDVDDVDTMMDDYRFDEEYDDESKVKKVKIAKKKVIVEAKKFFNAQKEKYKMPLESSSAGASSEEKEGYEAYKQYTKQAKTAQEEDSRKREWFQKKTNEVFDDGFKGFEFNVNDKKIVFTPGDAAEIKRNQITPMNFIGKFLDESGLMKDAVGYHKSLAVAMNPERFAKFFYEQGMADSADEFMRKTKNINMSERRAPETTIKGGVQVRAKDDSSGRNLKIKSIKKI